VLTTYRAISAHTRRLINDFSILMNTQIIDRVKAEYILDELASGKQIHQIINIDERHIEGLKCITYSDKGAATYAYGVDELPDGYKVLADELPLTEDCIRLGFVKRAELGLKDSQFTDLLYDEDKYKIALQEAKDLLEEAERKYQKLGTFNIEVSQCQERLYALKLKMGIIEVGADSDMSQQLLKDSVDDAVKAAESAYKHGVVLGCNVNLIQSIIEVSKETDDPVDQALIQILLRGFIDVYKTVLQNAFDNVKFDDTLSVDDFNQYVEEHMIKSGDTSDEPIFSDQDVLEEVIHNFKGSDNLSLHDIIIGYSIKTNKVFDISCFEFSDKVTNSLQTDTEILTATIDLISILIVGNQMVVTQKHNYLD
jgi:hypothetical protein